MTIDKYSQDTEVVMGVVNVTSITCCGARPTGVHAGPHFESIEHQTVQLRANLCIGVSIETIVDDYSEIPKDVQEGLESSGAMTRFPSWVEPSRVNKIKMLKCSELVREMLLSGLPTIEVARKVQSLGEMTTIKLESAKLYLDHYRATLPAWMMAARQQPKDYLQLKQRSDVTIDVLEKLARLYEMMEKRIKIGIANDEKFNFLTPHLEKNFAAASDLLMRIQEIREKLGIGPGQDKQSLPTNPAQQVDWSRIYARESVARVMADPDSRARVIRVAERMFDLYGKKLTPESLDRLNKPQTVTPSSPPMTEQVQRPTKEEMSDVEAIDLDAFMTPPSP